MTPDQILNAKRAELLARLATMERPALEREPDLIDAAVDYRMRESQAAEAQRARALLREVEAALTRYWRGEYGRCIEDKCHAHIAAKRLAAIPWAARCTTCEEKHARSAA